MSVRCIKKHAVGRKTEKKLVKTRPHNQQSQPLAVGSIMMYPRVAWTPPRCSASCGASEVGSGQRQRSIVVTCHSHRNQISTRFRVQNRTNLIISSQLEIVTVPSHQPNHAKHPNIPCARQQAWGTKGEPSTNNKNKLYLGLALDGPNPVNLNPNCSPDSPMSESEWWW